MFTYLLGEPSVQSKKLDPLLLGVDKSLHRGAPASRRGTCPEDEDDIVQGLSPIQTPVAS